MISSSSVARVFDGAARTYEATGTAYFDPMGQRLVDLADVQPGHRVLDVGTGRGAVLRPAARAAGAGRFVVGLDASMGMAALGAAVARHLPDVGPYVPRAFSGDAEATQAVIEAAGWRQVVTVVETQQVRFADIKAWWRWSWSHGQRRRWQSVLDLDRLREDVDAGLGLLTDPDGSLPYQPRAAFTTARAHR